MKLNKSHIIKSASTLCLFMTGLSFHSCIEQTFPQDNTATETQISKSPKAMQALLNAITGYMNAFNTQGGFSAYDFGYASIGLMRDIMGEDMYLYQTDMDYFPTFGVCRGLTDDEGEVYYIFNYYFQLLNLTNNLLRVVDLDHTTDVNRQYAGIAKVYRALVYMDISRFYEYKKTGISRLDNEAAQKKLYGLTVPIISEHISEKEARNNPRAPFYVLYKYVMDDLDSAEQLLSNYKRPSKDLPDQAVVYGMKARLWLEMASRFEQNPTELSTFISHVNMDISTAKDCYDKAAEYAQKAIDTSGSVPLTEEEWFGGKDYTQGFNTLNASSWMWGSTMNKPGTYYWSSFIGFVSSETNFGVSTPTYKSFRSISKALFDQIPDADWRKKTWIAVEDAGNISSKEKYHTLLDAATFASLPAYTPLKFKPAEGNMDDVNIGTPVDHPLMRVEEMYFIKAEALAGSKGVSAGVAALNHFMQNYRYPSYICNATTRQDFQKELILQKRIEFWGEGILYWDYKRLNLSVIRGYKGTNCPIGYRMNSKKGYCAPWFNLYFSKSEVDNNLAVIQNPDPSSTVQDWKE